MLRCCGAMWHAAAAPVLCVQSRRKEPLAPPDRSVWLSLRWFTLTCADAACRPEERGDGALSFLKGNLNDGMSKEDIDFVQVGPIVYRLR